MAQLSFVNVFIVVVSFSNLATLVACNRPIYNIAHMVNSVKQIDEYLDYGANAIEADVKFSTSGEILYFYHGFPCDIGRNCYRQASIDNYINAIRERTLPSSAKYNNNLVLFMFDVKLKYVKERVLLSSGEIFPNVILIPLYKNNPTKMKTIISVPNFTQKDFISGVLRQLNAKQPALVKKIGFDISLEKILTESNEKEQALKQLGVLPGHAWLSSGITNVFGSFYLDELRKQVKHRDDKKYFSKVYAWSLDKKSTAIKYFSINLDGVIANFPDRVNEAIKEINEKRSVGEKLRLATLDDDPFEVY